MFWQRSVRAVVSAASSASSSSSTAIKANFSLHFRRAFATVATRPSTASSSSSSSSSSSPSSSSSTTIKPTTSSTSSSQLTSPPIEGPLSKTLKHNISQLLSKTSSSSSSSSSPSSSSSSSSLSSSSLSSSAPSSSSSSSSSSSTLISKIIKPKPRTPGQRNVIKIDRSELWQRGPYWPLTVAVRKNGGRNNTGRIVIRRRGGGHRRRYRLIDWKRDRVDEPATVLRLEKDPNRTAYIALVRYNDNEVRYIIAPQDLVPGMTVMSSKTKQVDIKVGNSMPLHMMPIGTVLHNVELTPGRGAQLARSAGTFCQLMEKESSKAGYCVVQMASLERRYILANCMATIGTVSNPLHKIEQKGKAGVNRWLGRRPRVRACAMNPIDHPMGGGHNAKGRHPCSPKGIPAKGYKTVRTKNAMIIVPRGGLAKGEKNKAKA